MILLKQSNCHYSLSHFWKRNDRSSKKKEDNNNVEIEVRHIIKFDGRYNPRRCSSLDDVQKLGAYVNTTIEIKHEEQIIDISTSHCRSLYNNSLFLVFY